MKRGPYDNSHNRNRSVIDGRPQSSWATQAGLRNVHRDTRGNVIGGFTQDGKGWGNKSDASGRSGAGWQQKLTQPATSAPMPAPAAPQPVAMRPPAPAAPAPTTTAAAPPRKPAAAPVSKINGMPASQAIAKARVGAENAWQGKVAPVKFGAATATANLASKGLDGAVADYHARSAKAAGQNFAKAANAPAPKPAATWQQAALGTPKPTTPKPAPAPMAVASAPAPAQSNPTPSFTVPSVTNPTPVGTPPPTAAPGNDQKPSGPTARFVDPPSDHFGLRNQGYTYDQTQKMIKGRKAKTDPAAEQAKAAEYKNTHMGNTRLPKIPLPSYLEDTMYGGVVKYLNK